MLKQAKWIKAPFTADDGACLDFYRRINLTGEVNRATLAVSAIGMYIPYINGIRVSDDLYTPLWTELKKRVQCQNYDVTDLLKDECELSFAVAEGWAVGNIGFGDNRHYISDHTSLIYSLSIEYADGSTQEYVSDGHTGIRTNQITYTAIYHGESVDKTAAVKPLGNAVTDTDEKPDLIPQIGERVCEQEHIYPVKEFVTPKGEHVIDFGQNMSGYVVLRVKGNKGDRIALSHTEILDKDGNFYTESLRTAKQKMEYTLSGEEEELKPLFSWQGFRYVRVDECHEDTDVLDLKAVVVHSDIKRTGYFECGHEKVNQLYHNVIWGQKSNYIDVPTDCPQRNERLGWTGDALAFMRTAAINYDVERFFRKWLGDVALAQLPNGLVPNVVPTYDDTRFVSAAWSDASVICPWEIYLAYGSEDILRAQYRCMKGWIDYMHNAGDEEFLFLGGSKFGDWLALDGDSRFGGTDLDYLSSVFFAYSTSIFLKVSKALGEDAAEYEKLHQNVLKAIRERYFTADELNIKTQTAHALALRFGIAPCPEKTVDGLVKLIDDNGRLLSTGFVGTPHLLHALSENGRSDVAYDLLLTERLPSWLYQVNHGATTMWEHWDGIFEDGSLWDPEMNSFNHYAYGSVYDWIFGVAAGIKVCDDGAGYTHVTVNPTPDKRLGFLTAGIDSRAGRIESHWYYKGDEVYFEITVPDKTVADITLPDGRKYTVTDGKYIFTMRI
ncbi:MAG: family 78 glycoside hydrolase catalytic domain [Clostridia bacterium]|nr:family 78 glycoside hydrolase catalytic domain [Clostridia bacterium]